MRSGVKAVAFAEIDATLPSTSAGRLALRIAFDEQQDVFQVVHINEPSPIESTAYLIKYDSVHGEKGTTSAQQTCTPKDVPLVSPHHCITASKHVLRPVQAPGSTRSRQWMARLSSHEKMAARRC